MGIEHNHGLTTIYSQSVVEYAQLGNRFIFFIKKSELVSLFFSYLNTSITDDLNSTKVLLMTIKL
jgi:hypothetical protein